MERRPTRKELDGKILNALLAISEQKVLTSMREASSSQAWMGEEHLNLPCRGAREEPRLPERRGAWS